MTLWQTIAVVFVVRFIVMKLIARFVAARTVPNLVPPTPEAIEEENTQVAQLEKRWTDAVRGLGKTEKQYLVIGAGFLGTRIISALVLRGERVRAFDMVISEALKTKFPEVMWIQGNVNDMDALRAACRGVDVVYSTFATIRYWESLPYQLPASMTVNVDGTTSVIEACLAENVPMLVSTSTSNVCVTKDLTIVQEFNEDTPYVNNLNAPHHYAYTKAIAEQLVLSANGKPLANGGKLQTVCVRPCSGIFGSNDRLVLERMLTNKKYEIVVTSVIDWVYVDNVAWGHLLAERGLREKSDQVAGKSFCVSNNEVMSITDMLGYAMAMRPSLTLQRLPRWLMFGMSDTLDFLRGIFKERFPALGELQQLSRTSFVAAGLNYVLKSTRAATVLGYKPVFTVKEGVFLGVTSFEAARGIRV